MRYGIREPVPVTTNSGASGAHPGGPSCGLSARSRTAAWIRACNARRWRLDSLAGCGDGSRGGRGGSAEARRFSRLDAFDLRCLRIHVLPKESSCGDYGAA